MQRIFRQCGLHSKKYKKHTGYSNKVLCLLVFKSGTRMRGLFEGFPFFMILGSPKIGAKRKEKWIREAPGILRETE